MDAWYYSTGGRQNGPVPLNELIRLYATGTVGPKDLVWREGMSNWQPAEEVPDLRPPAPTSPPPAPSPAAAAAGAAPLNPYQAPTNVWSDPSAPPAEYKDEIVPGSQPLMIGAIISRSWELVKQHFGLILGAGITYFLLSIAVSEAFGFATKPFEIGHNYRTDEPVLSGPGQAIAIIGGLISQVFDIFLTLGLTRIGLNLVSGKPADFNMLFGESSKLLNGVIGFILFGLMVGVGLILLIVPGIYLALRFGQYQYAIVDKNMNAIDALKYSSRITDGNKGNLFGLYIVFFLIIIAGILALVLGLVVAIPITYMAQYLAYRWLQYGQEVVVRK